MKITFTIVILISFIWPATIFAQRVVSLSSPDKNIVFNIKLENKKAAFSVKYKGRLIVDHSPLSLHFADNNFNENLIINKPSYKDSTEDYNLVFGKTSHVHDEYCEAVIPIEQQKAPHRSILFTVRIFNDGLAFRYEFPNQTGWDSLSLSDENTSFNFLGDPLVRTLFHPDFLNSHEGLYRTLLLSEVKADTLMDMPALFQFKDNLFVAITEAALLDYAGMYLVKRNGVLVSQLSPLPGQSLIKVKATLPHKSPWRVMMISDRVGALIESNILTSLNEPSKIKDVSWLKPGKTTFPWWNGNVVPDTLNAPGNNFVTNQYYIDFCARNKIEYHSVVEYGLHQWYMDDGVSFMPGPHADVTTPVPGLNMQEICDYAKQKGVGIRVWVHWAALYPKLDSAFTLFEKWGIQGMMVDFMDRDDQQMVNIQTEILQKAAAHHLHIQFHGAYKPTGLNRTYPNEFTREGTLNYEADKWNPEGVSPDHDIDIPFTRMLAGSTDYHLGGFRAITKEKFKAQYTRPLVLGTRCHMLAMYVVLENYLQMVCDYPTAYEGEPGFEFIKQIPTTWNETRVPMAKPSEYIVVARRKGNDWYIGAITNHSPRQLNLPLLFLPPGEYTAEIFADAKDAESNPNHLSKQALTVTSHAIIPLHLSAGGGQVLALKKIQR